MSNMVTKASGAEHSCNSCNLCIDVTLSLYYFGAHDHLLFEVVVLFLSRPGDAHSPKAGGEAARIETLSAVGIGRQLDGAIHARRRGTVEFDAAPDSEAGLLGRQGDRDGATGGI